MISSLITELEAPQLHGHHDPQRNEHLETTLDLTKKMWKTHENLHFSWLFMAFLNLLYDNIWVVHPILGLADGNVQGKLADSTSSEQVKNEW